MIESNADRLAFFNTQEFGVTAKVASNSSGAESEIVGIFDSQYLNLDLGAGSVSTSDLQFMCRTSDVTNFTQGDTVEIESVRYEISDVQPDGTGVTVLKLHRV